MATNIPMEQQYRAHRAMSQTYGRMTGVGKIAYAGTAATLTNLAVGRYYLYPDGGDLAINDAGTAVADGTCPMLQGGSAVTIWLGGATGTFTLSAIGNSGATGNLWVASCDDVG